MKKRKEFKLICPKNRNDWRDWLSKNHLQSESVWLVLFKKDSDKFNLSSDDAVEEALCFGWIDSVPGKIDDLRYKLLVSPRKVKSAWSELNQARVRKLIKQGLMAKAGLAKIAEAKKNGAWNRLKDVNKLLIPFDLQKALEGKPQAAKFFKNFSPSSQRAILEWLLAAKKEETRKKRISEIVTMASKGLRANFPSDRARLAD